MKRAIAQRLGAGAPPRAVAEEYARHAANREIRATLARIEAEGVPCLYRSADVRDAAAVGRALAEARATLGPVRVLVHAAGVIADRRIEEKRLEQFEQVFSTKVEGLRVLLDQTRVDDLRAIAVFSSSTGPLRPRRPDRLRGGERGRQQASAGRGEEAAESARHQRQLGPLGGWNGHAGSPPGLRGGGRGPHSARRWRTPSLARAGDSPRAGGG
jgi:NAD(P)-dependent dehydrogenase (short-subunit alcohol dehydrogenase family)